jgi:hypothetical protein
MIHIEGLLDEEVWEARVMSDSSIDLADLVSPGDEEVWAELEKQKDEEQKDIDGYERLLQMDMEEVEATRVEISTEPYLGPWDEDLTEVGQAWSESYGGRTHRKIPRHSWSCYNGLELHDERARHISQLYRSCSLEQLSQLPREFWESAWSCAW